jgi:hypothetical protein
LVDSGTQNEKKRKDVTSQTNSSKTEQKQNKHLLAVTLSRHPTNTPYKHYPTNTPYKLPYKHLLAVTLSRQVVGRLSDLQTLLIKVNARFVVSQLVKEVGKTLIGRVHGLKRV